MVSKNSIGHAVGSLLSHTNELNNGEFLVWRMISPGVRIISLSSHLLHKGRRDSFLKPVHSVRTGLFVRRFVSEVSSPRRGRGISTGSIGRWGGAENSALVECTSLSAGTA